MARQYTKHQVVVLTIYALISLPLLPLMAVVYPFTKWVVYGGKSKLDLMEFLSMSMTFSLLIYLMGIAVWLDPPTLQ